jgi:hypothetical protein
MNNFDQLFPQDLYHSYIVETNGDDITRELILFLEDRKEIESNSADLLCQTYEAFTMNDSLEIKEWHSRRGITLGKKICIICAKFINREAEQTLLKIIEEPGENTHFFIVVPDSSVLLPTIISRTHILRIESKDNLEIQREAVNFIKSEPKDRIDIVALIIKDNKDEENSGKLRSYATSFINALEGIFYKRFKENINDKNTKFILDELQKSRGYLKTPGASVKMILENIALVI